MSPRCFGKVMTGGPVRSTGAQDMVPSCPAPAVPEQRRRSTLEPPATRRQPAHEPCAHATDACAAALAATLAADPHVAVEPDLRRPGTLASGLPLPLAGSKNRGTRSARHSRSA